MPYIPEADRPQALRNPRTVGELTYLIYHVIMCYHVRDGSFQNVAEVLGALSAAEKEFYRRVVAPYEDLKIQENGDVI